jgi:hypothetical protein
MAAHPLQQKSFDVPAFTYYGSSNRQGKRRGSIINQPRYSRFAANELSRFCGLSMYRQIAEEGDHF